MDKVLTCSHCAVKFEKIGRIARKYCSDDCRAAAKRVARKSQSAPRCIICSTEFIRKSGRQVLCGDEACYASYKLQYHKDYRDSNRGRLNEAARSLYHAAKSANPESVREKSRRYARENRDRINENRRTPERRRKAADMLLRKVHSDHRLRLNVRMSANIYHALADKKCGRGWESVVGYSLGDLVKHLERQFARGMTWDNWGKGPDCWHIDHIVPKASFSFDNDNDPDFKACWALTNLRPLWQPDNQSKSAKMLVMI